MRRSRPSTSATPRPTPSPSYDGDGTAQVVTITINGTNDAAVITGTSSGTVVEAGGVANAIAGTPTATGTLTDTDVDNTANTFQAVAAPAASQRLRHLHGRCVGHWTYTLDNSNATVQALNVGEHADRHASRS